MYKRTNDIKLYKVEVEYKMCKSLIDNEQNNLNACLVLILRVLTNQNSVNTGITYTPIQRGTSSQWRTMLLVVVWNINCMGPYKTKIY